MRRSIVHCVNMGDEMSKLTAEVVDKLSEAVERLKITGADEVGLIADVFGELITDWHRQRREIGRCKVLLRTAQQLISSEGLEFEEDFYRFQDDLKAALKEKGPQR